MAAITPRTGLVVAVEATGYSGSSANRTSRLLEGWSVGKAARLGADGVKLLSTTILNPPAPLPRKTSSRASPRTARHLSARSSWSPSRTHWTRSVRSCRRHRRRNWWSRLRSV